MQLQPNEPRDTEEAQRVSVDGLLRTHWTLAVCVLCGHEQPRGERCRATCPGCGAQLHAFRMYRALRAER